LWEEEGASGRGSTLDEGATFTNVFSIQSFDIKRGSGRYKRRKKVEKRTAFLITLRIPLETESARAEFRWGEAKNEKEDGSCILKSGSWGGNQEGRCCATLSLKETLQLEEEKED